MMVSRGLFALIALLSTPAQLSAKGGSYHTEDRYNPQHIESLPDDIRNSILRRCRVPKALHPFASYSNNARRIVLHYEHFMCDGSGTYCARFGCLHQVHVLVGGHYRLLQRYYAPEGDR